MSLREAMSGTGAFAGSGAYEPTAGNERYGGLRWFWGPMGLREPTLPGRTACGMGAYEPTGPSLVLGANEATGAVVRPMGL